MCPFEIGESQTSIECVSFPFFVPKNKKYVHKSKVMKNKNKNQFKLLFYAFRRKAIYLLANAYLYKFFSIIQSI